MSGYEIQIGEIPEVSGIIGIKPQVEEETLEKLRGELRFVDEQVHQYTDHTEIEFELPPEEFAWDETQTHIPIQEDEINKAMRVRKALALVSGVKPAQILIDDEVKELGHEDHLFAA